MFQQKFSLGAIFRNLKNYFLAGLLLLIPIFLAIYVLFFILKLVTNLNLLLPDSLLSFLQINLGLYDSVISSILFLLFLIFITLLGYSSKVYFGKQLINLFSFLITKLPVVGGIYKATRNLLDTMFSGGDNFKGVCLIRYPNDNSSYTMAFITGKVPAIIQKKFEKTMINCFVPTTPNPTSGFYLIVAEDDIIHLDMKIDAALGILLSLGSSSKEVQL